MVIQRVSTRKVKRKHSVAECPFRLQELWGMTVPPFTLEHLLSELTNRSLAQYRQLLTEMRHGISGPMSGQDLKQRATQKVCEMLGGIHE